MRVHQQLAYVLVNRPYSETSWVVDVFSRDYGRLSLMAKGARRIKSRLKGTLLPFQPTLVSWTGKGEIPTLTSAEIHLADYKLLDHEFDREARVCGFYCNELVTKLLHRHDPHSWLFDQYHSTMLELAVASASEDLAKILRNFEKIIIRETGYEVSFEFEADGKTMITDSAHYRLQAGQGFVRVEYPQPDSTEGRTIRQLGQQSAPLTNQDASQEKRIMRDILRHALGRNEIVSRALFYPKARRT